MLEHNLRRNGPFLYTGWPTGPDATGRRRADGRPRRRGAPVTGITREYGEVAAVRNRRLFFGPPKAMSETGPGTRGR